MRIKWKHNDGNEYTSDVVSVKRLGDRVSWFVSKNKNHSEGAVPNSRVSKIYITPKEFEDLFLRGK